MTEDPGRARQFTRMLFELHQSMADELAELLDMNKVDKLMDLGGGSGVVSLALLRRHSRLSAVVVDIANVCTASREIAAEESLGDRITYFPANFLEDELPSGFDMVIECDVNVYSEALFRKVRAALEPGGRFVIADEFAVAEGVAPPSREHWAFQKSMVDPRFAFPTAAHTRVQLEAAGFHIVSESNLPAAREDKVRFTSNLVVIEASNPASRG